MKIAPLPIAAGVAGFYFGGALVEKIGLAARPEFWAIDKADKPWIVPAGRAAIGLVAFLVVGAIT